MRNKTDKTFNKDDIRKYQDLFRVLEKWSIDYGEQEPYEGQVCENPETGETYYINGQSAFNKRRKAADIYPCPGDVPLDDYLFHEVLHLAISAAEGHRDRQEFLVQDICKLRKSLVLKSVMGTIGAIAKALER